MLLNALFLPLYLLRGLTGMTSLRGRVVFPLLCAKISLSASSFSDCYDWMFQFSIFLLKYMYFTLFSTFNLILSPTVMAGRSGH